MGLELLAPARNLDMGRLALRCGADALYAGGPAFGARRRAGNSLDDLDRLAREAHRLGSRLYVTLNTLLFEDELEPARKLAWDLAGAGVDGLILQDLAYLEMDLPPLRLHASTQAVCDRPERVAFLASLGFHRAVLARELNLAEIQAIRAACPLELEAFVYGALCVAESGQCGLGHALEGRSGNRGACSQPCRRSWDLVDAEGRVLQGDRPLLSLQDLDRSDHLEALAEAGITSFKLEGRMKDADYLKNTVGHLRRHMDALLTRRPDLGTPSGTDLGFEPDPKKTFHRGHTAYGLLKAHEAPGSGAASGFLGEALGPARLLGPDRWELEACADLAPGDLLAQPGPSGRVVTARLVAVEGSRLQLEAGSRLGAGPLFRCQDARWLTALRRAEPHRPARPLPPLKPLPAAPPTPALPVSALPTSVDFRANVANSLAKRLWERLGVRVEEPALELLPDPGDRVLMTTRLCLRREAGACPRLPDPCPWPEGPLFLHHEGHRLAVQIDCGACRMVIRRA